jgi:hypothetical protein
MKTIAWDVDDVLNELMRTWLAEAWLPAHPGCRIGYEEITTNPPHELLGCKKAEYLASLDEFRRSAAGREMQPNAEVLAWFGRHGSRFRHVAITAVPLAAAHLSAAWVMRYFGRWIRTFHMLPSHRDGEDLPLYDRSKGEALAQWKAIDALVDDHPRNLASAEQLGIRTFCVPRPWNQAAGSLTDMLEGLTEL